MTENPIAAKSLKPTWWGWVKGALQVALSVTLVFVSLSAVDTSSLRDRPLQYGWLAFGLFMTLPPVWASAVRWRAVSVRLGLPLAFGTALREYYVSIFANQVLPSGIAGEVLRAARHGASLGATRAHYAKSLQAVVLERLAGQIALWALILAGLPMWLEGSELGVAFPIGAGAALLMTALGILWSGRLRRAAQWTLRTIFSLDFARLLIPSLVTVASCVVLFATCAKALSAPLAPAALLQVAPLVLASMTLPVSIGGWGVRELATATLYGLTGMDPALGTATSILYGLVNLVGSIPGAVLALRWRHAR